MLFLVCWEVFIMKECWICQIFFCIYCNNHVIFILILIMWWLTLIDFHLLKDCCNPEINSIWLWCVIILMCCWIKFVINSRDFCIYFIRDVSLQFFCFFVVSLSAVWYQGSLTKWIWNCSPPPLSLLEDFEQDWHQYYFKCLVEFTSEAI